MFARRKIIRALAMSAVATTALAACSTSDNNAGDENTLTIFWKGSEKPGIDAVVAAFKEANPGVDVVVSTADVEQYQATLRTQLSAGSAADVIFTWPARGNSATISEVAPGGYLEDLSDREWASQYPPAIRDLASYDGKVYLMAPAVTSFGPWYNADALAETGLTPPSTWSEVIPFCEAAQDAGKVAWAIGAATLNANQNVLFGLVPDLVHAVDPDFDERIFNGETTFSENEGWNTAVERLAEMRDAGCFNPDATGNNQDDQNRMVASGEALGMFGMGYQLAALKSLAPDTEFTIYPFSSDDDPSNDLMTVSNAGGASVNAKAANKELALKFVDYLGSAEGLTIYTEALAAAVPSIPTGEEYEDTNLATITEYLANNQTTHFLDQKWPTPRIQQAMYSGVQGLLSGTTTPAEVLAAMDAEIGN